MRAQEIEAGKTYEGKSGARRKVTHIGPVTRVDKGHKTEVAVSWKCPCCNGGNRVALQGFARWARRIVNE